MATRWRVSNDILSQSQPPTLVRPVVRRTSGPVGRQGRSSAAQAKLSCGAAGGPLDHGYDYCCKQPRPHRQYAPGVAERAERSEEHTSELQSLMSISYAFFCLKQKN